MTLLVAGYWHTTYWCENYWQQDYWPEYGAPVVTEGDKWIGEAVLRKKPSRELLLAIRQFFEAELDE